MNLHEWIEQHRDDLKIEEPKASGVADLLAVAAREIGDAESVLSDDGRLEHAFAACLAISAAMLAASGYRTRHGALAHHFLLIESLQYTVGITSAEANELQLYRQKRSRSMYERVGLVSETEARAALDAARRLRKVATVWLTREHPGLAPLTLDASGTGP